MTRAVFIAIAILASVFLAGCGSKDTANTETTTSKTTESSAAATTSAESEKEGEAAEPGQTVQEYLDENGITKTDLLADTPDVLQPTVPIPAGWTDLGGSKDEGLWGAIALTDTKDTPDPTMVIVTYSKFNGPVDPAKILELAPNKLTAGPDWAGPEAATPIQVSGFDAVTIEGTSVDAGKPVFAGLTTVMIPRQDGVYEMRIMAKGPPDQEAAITQAMSLLNTETKIQP
jgi:hypothetical protein